MNEKKRHSDFEYIFGEFIKIYGDKEGLVRYNKFLVDYGLDDSKSYSLPQESFDWTKGLIQSIKSDENSKYYKAVALVVTTSMNRNKYSRDELLRGARTIIGQPINMNHDKTKDALKDVEVWDGEFENDRVEVILRADTKGETAQKLDSREYVALSIEGESRESAEDGDGISHKGLRFTGLALLDNKTLAGVPLTYIEPFEKLQESVKKIKELQGQFQEVEWDVAYINNLPDMAFAYIADGGEKDDQGKTVPRNLRNLPHHNASVKSAVENDSVDLPHLRNALARVAQTNIPAAGKASARKHLLAHAKALLPTYTDNETFAYFDDMVEDKEIVYSERFGKVEVLVEELKTLNKTLEGSLSYNKEQVSELKRELKQLSINVEMLAISINIISQTRQVSLSSEKKEK